MLAVSSGSIDAVRFDSLVTLVRGEECMAFDVAEIADLLVVLQSLASHGRREVIGSLLERAIEAGAIDDLDDLDGLSSDGDDDVFPFSVPDESDEVVAPQPRGGRGATSVRSGRPVPTATAGSAEAPRPAVTQSPAPETKSTAVLVAEPQHVSAPPAPAPAAPVKAGLERPATDRRPAAELITNAVVDYLRKRVHPQSFDRIQKAIRKAPGVPDDVDKHLLELLKRLVKKGTLVRSQSGGFSVEGD